MYAHFLFALTAGLLLASDPSQEAAPERLGQLSSLEKQLLEAWKNRDAGTARSLLAEDYVEIGGPGPQRMTKPDVLKVLAESRITDYSLEDVRLVRLNSDAAVLTYKLTVNGSLNGKQFPTHPAYVSSAWVRRGGAWLSVFRQRTPVDIEGGGAPLLTTFEAALTPGSVRYLYKGTAKLEDIHATLDITLGRGRIASQTYWGTWQPGEVKEIGLGFLAFGAGAVERIDLSATATRDGKQVLCAASSRRQATLPFDWRMIPPILGLP